MFCYIIFGAANIGLALQNNYVALLILRMLQSAGSSGTVSLANGVVGDIITSAERGTYIGYASLGGFLGPSVAPILGGVIAQYAGWHFLFWFQVRIGGAKCFLFETISGAIPLKTCLGSSCFKFLPNEVIANSPVYEQLIFSTAVFVPLILFLPETCRNVVDNGSIPPPFFSRNITDTIRHRHRAKRGLVIDSMKQAEIRKNYRMRFPNPLATLVAVTDLETAIILLSTGLGLGCFYAVR
jgi:MFS family permease